MLLCVFRRKYIDIFSDGGQRFPIEFGGKIDGHQDQLKDNLRLEWWMGNFGELCKTFDVMIIYDNCVMIMIICRIL